MRTPQKIAITAVILILLASGIYHFRKEDGPKRRADGGEPQKSIDEIYQERSNQAAGQLLTPIGKAFATKNWAEFKSLYQPQTHFHLLAEIIRAHYIQNRFSGFNAEDMDQVLKITYDTFERIEPKNRPQASLLITQFQRLPLPQKRSSTYQQLESWLEIRDSNFLRRLAIIKLVTQDLNPSENATKAFIAGYQSPPEGSLPEWIRLTDEIRSVPVRKRCLKDLFKIYPNLKGPARAQALVTLGREPELNPTSLAKMALDSLSSEEQDAFEAALRTLPGLVTANALNSEQKSKAVNRLSALPEKLKTPFVTAKVGELLPQLSPPR